MTQVVKKTSLRLEPKLHTQLKKRCIDLDISMSDGLAEAVTEWLKKRIGSNE